jgi:hypothetical protein
MAVPKFLSKSERMKPMPKLHAKKNAKLLRVPLPPKAVPKKKQSLVPTPPKPPKPIPRPPPPPQPKRDPLKEDKAAGSDEEAQDDKELDLRTLLRNQKLKKCQLRASRTDMLCRHPCCMLRVHSINAKDYKMHCCQKCMLDDEACHKKWSMKRQETEVPHGKRCEGLKFFKRMTEH